MLNIEKVLTKNTKSCHALKKPCKVKRCFFDVCGNSMSLKIKLKILSNI